MRQHRHVTPSILPDVAVAVRHLLDHVPCRIGRKSDAIAREVRARAIDHQRTAALQQDPENRHQVPGLIFLGGDAARHNQAHESARLALAHSLPLQAGEVKSRHGALAH